MPDERMESLRQGIAADPASSEAKAAEERRRRELVSGPKIESAMGGTSDSDSPADESHANANRNDRTSDDELERLRRRGE